MNTATKPSSHCPHNLFFSMYMDNYYLSVNGDGAFHYWHLKATGKGVVSKQVDCMDRVYEQRFWCDHIPLEVIQEVYRILDEHYKVAPNSNVIRLPVEGEIPF